MADIILNLICMLKALSTCLGKMISLLELVGNTACTMGILTQKATMIKISLAHSESGLH